MIKSGKDLLIHLDIKPFELLNYVKEGHQPLDQFGRPIPPPNIYAKTRQLKKLREDLKLTKYMPWEISAPTLEKIKTIEKDLDCIENKESWVNYELPDDDESAQWVIDQLKDAFFEIEQEAEKDSPKEVLLPQEKEISGNFFTREGDVWHIGFKGKETRVRHQSGLQHIALLLESPGSAISCLKIYQAANPAEARLMSEDDALAEELNMPTRTKSFDAINDGRARKEKWMRYRKLQEDQAKNEREGADPIIQTEIKEEMDVLEKEMKQRTFRDPIHGKAQNNISRAIARANNAMKRATMNELSQFLNDHIKSDGTYGYIYTGPPWRISR